MESLNPEFAPYVSNNEFARTDTVFFPPSEVTLITLSCNGGHFKSNESHNIFQGRGVKANKNCIRMTLNLSTFADRSNDTKTHIHRQKRRIKNKHVSGVTFQLSGVRCQVSGVTFCMSLVTCHLSPVNNAKNHSH